MLAHVVEISWAGGPGAAAAFAGITRRLASEYPLSGMADYGDLAILSAAAGMTWGIFSGLILVNYLRKKYPPAVREDGSSILPAVEEHSEPDSSQNANSFLMAAGLMIASVFLAMLFRSGAAYLSYTTVSFFSWTSAIKTMHFIEELPLFFLSLLAAIFARKTVEKIGLMDRAAVKDASRINGAVLEVLIVSAVSTVSIASIRSHLFDFVVLMILAALFSAFSILFFAKRMLPSSVWLELGLINYGMATGTTALGFLLLKNYRTSLRSGPVRIYGLAVPFSAPFIGGGIVSLLLPGLTAAGYGWAVFGTASIGLVLLYAGARIVLKYYR